MNSERRNDWLGLLGLAAGGVFLFSIVYYASVWASRPENYSADPGREKIVLARGEAKTIGTEKIIYRGLDGDDRFSMAVVLLQMDPEYPYIHRLDIGKAKRGFSLVGHRFELISASRSRVRFWHLKEPPLLAMAAGGAAEPRKPRLGPKNAWGP